MKKTLLKVGFLFFIIFAISGCKKNEIEGSKITTTTYPIEYIVSRLYGYDSSISSIYPNDTVTSEYSLTDKQIKDYAKSTDIFVYNGLTNERDVAKKLVAKNKKMDIINASDGLKYTYGVEELWLSPNKFLSMATIIKDRLEELSNNKLTIETIDKNYLSLKEELSKLDANLRYIAKNAPSEDRRTVVVTHESLKFLEGYGFNVIYISDDSKVSDLRNKFKEKNYLYILVADTQKTPSYIEDIRDNYGTELVSVNIMDTLTAEERANNDNYLTIMNGFLDTLSNKVNQ